VRTESLTRGRGGLRNKFGLRSRKKKVQGVKQEERKEPKKWKVSQRNRKVSNLGGMGDHCVATVSCNPFGGDKVFEHHRKEGYSDFKRVSGVVRSHDVEGGNQYRQGGVRIDRC